MLKLCQSLQMLVCFDFSCNAEAFLKVSSSGIEQKCRSVCVGDCVYLLTKNKYKLGAAFQTNLHLLSPVFKLKLDVLF